MFRPVRARPRLPCLTLTLTLTLTLALSLTLTPTPAPTLTRYLKTAAKHFWTGTIEQHLQWYKYEPTPGDYEASQQSVEELLDWADEKGWPGMRGLLLDANPNPKAKPNP